MFFFDSHSADFFGVGLRTP